jgi:hypothetical protein
MNSNKFFSRLFFTTAALALSGLGSAQVPSNVPAQYKDLYTSLQTQLSSMQKVVPSGTKSNVTYASQFLTANSETNADVTKPGYMNAVLMELQGQQALGIQALTLHINFPTLYAPYYSNQTDFQQVLNFYQSVASEVRGRGLKLIVETQVAKSSSSPAQSSYVKSLSWADYQKGRALNAAAIAQYLHPDYMAVITEPDTEATASGHVEAGTLAGSMSLLKTILTAVQNVVGTSVPLGAGLGTWQPGYDTFLKAYATTSIKFLDLHVYPINRDFFQRCLNAADIARQAGKQITVSEAWLWKARDNELAKMSFDQLDQRNIYAFWAPLDAQFLQELVDLANYKQFAFISPGYSNYYWAYVNSTSATLTVKDAMQQAAAALNVGAFTGTGLAWEKAILNGSDQISPVVPGAPAVFKAPFGLSITWRPSYDNIGVAGYRVYKNSKLIGTTYSTGTTDPAGRIGSTDVYSVVAFDAAGNSSPQSAAAKSPLR